jgi:hypothetical protein
MGIMIHPICDAFYNSVTDLYTSDIMQISLMIQFFEPMKEGLSMMPKKIACIQKKF